jgi:phenylacetate-CoA ligase
VDSLSRDELLALQAARLREFLTYVDRRNPFYQKRFREAGVDLKAADIRAELTKIAPIDKTVLRERLNEMFSTEFIGRGNMCKTSTSGSTGTPLVIYYDHVHDLRRLLRSKRQMRWLGSDGYGSKMVLPGGGRNLRERLEYLAQRFLLNARTLNVYHHRKADYGRLVADLRKDPPEILVGLFSVLRQIARRAEEEHEPLRGIKTTFAVGEVVAEHDRREAEQWLGAPLYVQYGCNEVGMVGQECREQAGCHYAQDDMVIEALDESGRPASSGNLTFTYFVNRVIPLVRYQIGDTVTLATDPCPCGLPYDRLQNIDGRLAQMVALPNGRAVPGTIFGMVMREYPWVWEFQAEQVAADHIIMRVTRRANAWNKESHRAACKRIAELLSSEMKVEWRFEEPFLPVPSGKHLSFISRLEPCASASVDPAPRAGNKQGAYSG